MEPLLALMGCVLGFLGWDTARKARADLAALRTWLAAQGLAGPGAEPAAPHPYGPRPGTFGPTSAQQPASGPLPQPPGPTPPPPAPLPPPPALPPASPPAPPPRPRIDIEVLLTQRWGVWLGAVALLLAGVFLVRTAMEQGWLGPGPRCAMGVLLGVALIAAAWWLRGRPVPGLPLPDDAPPALAAGGVAVLFAAAYAAGPLYGLVPGPIAFALLAAAGGAGLALALVFGPLVAAVGLVAAFATPVLVQTDDPSLPGLFAYLLVVSAACWTVVRLTAWTWLGWGAALCGAGWVALSAFGIGHDAWAPGLFVPAAASLTLLLLPGAALEHPMGRRFAWAPMLMLAAAGLVLEAVTGDPWARAGLLLLGPVAIAKGWTEPRLAWLPMVGAGVAVLALLAWAVPGFGTTDEAITIEGVVQAVLPGAWVPAAILPFLQACAAVALLHAGAGLWNERRSPNPLPWAALVGAVPVLVLAVAYLQVGRFQARPAWALAAALLAAGLVTAAGAARRGGSLQRAGVHAAGAVAALALGCAIVLEAAWLTVALALMLPALAWIEGAAGLPQLRRVAMIVAGVVLVRLVLNPYLPLYALGATPVLNLLLVAYGIPAACFAVAAWLFRRRGADRLVAVLQAGACLFGGLLLVLEVRHWAQDGNLNDDRAPGLVELGWWTTLLGLYAAGLLAIGQRLGQRVLLIAGRVAGVLALALGVVLLVVNPFVTNEGMGRGVLLSMLLPAYLIPSALAVACMRLGARPRRVLGVYALLAVLMWASATVRQAFHPGQTALWDAPVLDAELWALSGAWFVLAAGVMGAGLWSGRRALRLAGLALVALVVGKVFLVDMSGLQGLWRVLSFLGLGLGLIGLGALYRRFGGVGAEAAPRS